MKRALVSGIIRVTLLVLSLPSVATAQLVLGPGPGGTPTVHLIDGTTTRTVDVFNPAFLGGASLTLGDVNGDGTLDIIAGAGPGGGPHVRVLSGVDFSVLASFYAYDPAFAGGVYVAAGDIDGDGRTDIITGAGPSGGPHVRVFSGIDLRVLASFFAYDPAFPGGMSVAAGDINGDGRADIITGAGPSGGPHVRVFSGTDLGVLASFYAYAVAFPGGVSVAAGDVNGDGLADIITGAGPSGGPHVRVFSGADLSVLASFYAYDPAFLGGVQVAAGDVNGDGRIDLIMGAGPGGGPHVRILSGLDLSELASFFAPTNGSGVSVGSLGDAPGVRFTSASTTSFVVGSAGSFTITTAGTPPPAITSSGPLPAGVTVVDNGDGTATLSGTPAAGTAGTYPLTFTADNGTGTPATQNFTFTVDEPPAITSASTAAMTIDAASTFTVTTTGFPVPTLTIGGAALPAGVTFVDNGDGTGTLGGTPDASGAGTHAITFTADNGVSPAATQAFTLTVSGAPTFTSAATATFTAGSPGSFSVTTVGTPAGALSVAGTLPAGVTFVDNGNGTGTLSGTPAAGTGGTYPLTFSATNSEGSATQSFTLTVQQAPSITSAGATTFTVGSPAVFIVATAGLPVASLTLGGTLPAGVTFVDNGNGIGTLSGTPAAGAGGIHALQFTATNGVGSSAPQAFTLTVNEAPGVTSAVTATFAAGAAGSFTLTTTGFPMSTITLTGALPGGVTFADNLDGTATFSGVPAADTAGAYVFTITITNGVGSPLARTFTLNIDEGPVITSASSATFAVGAANSFTVVATGFPAPSLVLGGAALPAGVTWVDVGNGSGTLSGTPEAGTGGDYALTFTASNDSGSAVQNFTLTVAGSPGFTSAATTTFTVGTPGSFTVTAIGAPPPAITVSGTLPVGVTFADNGGGSGTLSGTPAAGTDGTYALTFTAANGVLPDGTQVFTLIVNQAPVVTSAVATTFTVGTVGSFTVTTGGFPLPTLAIGGAALPSGVTFVDNGDGTGTLSGTPAAGTGGTYAITFTATNTVGASAPQAFTLTVNQAPAITSVNSVSFVVGTPGTFTVTTTGFPAPAITRTGVALPDGVTFVDNGNGTATLSGTPAAGAAGSYAFTLTAANSTPPSAGQAFTLNVNQPPAITSANATTFLVGTPGSFTVTTTGFPVPTLTLTAGTLPAGVTFTDNGNGTATLSGTPTAPGAFVLQFTAANGAGAPAVQSFTLTVNQAPSFTSAASTNFTEDVPGSFTVTTQGTPTPALIITGTLPAGVTFTDNGNGTATLAGTPAAGGTFPLTFTANNGVGSPVSQAFTLTVTEVNDAPSFVLAGAPPTVAEDAGPQTVAAFATLISAGPANEAGQTLTFVVQNNSNPGLFSLAPAVSPATGALTYTSGTNAFGTATITLVLQDNGGTANGGVNTSAPQMFTITVLPVNDPPIVAAETFQLLGNTELRVDMPAGTTPHTSETTTGVSAVEGVLDNDGDPEGDPIAVTAIANCTVADTTAPFDCTLTGGAVVHVDANGEFSYTPAPGATTGSFTYTVTDTPAQGTAANVTGTVTFTILEMVWYVRNDASAGTGTSRAPLNALTTLNGAGGAGDVDDGNDYIFVDFGDGTSTGQVGGLELEAGQQLIGEFVGLSIPVNLNLNGSPTVVVPPPAATDCSGGPCRPLLSHATGNALSLTEAMAATIRGFRLAGGSTGNAIDVTTDGALTGSATLTIADNVFQGAGLEGLDVNLIAGTTGTLALTVLGNVWDNAAAHGGNAIDISRLAGVLNLTLSSNLNIESALNAVVINGGTAASTNIIGFANNTVHTDTGGAGMIITNVMFDAVPGGVVDAVAGGVLTIGVDGNGVGGSGLTLASVQGNLGFTDLDVYGGTTGLSVTGDATLGVALTVVPAGSGGTSEVKGANGAAVTISNAAINLQLAELASTFAAGSGVSLTTVSGTFSVPSGSTIAKSGGSAAAFVVNNSAAGTTALTSTYAGTITNTSGTGASVSVTTADAGSSVIFTGAITANPGIGISLTNNTGATVSFSGGLTLNAGANAAFTATGGGTVQVCDENPCNPTVTGALVNTLATTTGTALNVANTTIGAGGLEFRSISANGGVNGIVLNNTGSSGRFIVTGNGGTCNSLASCTGGAIQNTTSHGVSLTNTLNPSFTRIGIQNTSGSGIEGTGVTGFTLQNSFIDNSGTGGVADDSNVAFNNQAAGTETNISGTLTITNNILTNGRWHGLMVQNFNGTLDDTIVTGNTITSSTSLASSLGYGINFQILGSASTVSNLTKANISGNTVTNFPSAGGIQVQGGNSNAAGVAGILGVAGHATNIISITGNLVRGQSAANRMATSAILYTVSGKGQGNVDISSNGTLAAPIGNNTGTTIGVGANGNTTLTATTNNNFVEANHPGTTGDSGISGGVGVTFGVTDVADMTWTINGNNIRNVDGNGILAVARGTNGALRVKIQNNDVEAPQGGVRPGIRVDAGNTTASSDNDVCLNILGNVSAGSGGSEGIGLRKQGTSTTVHAFGVNGMAATSSPGVETYVSGLNPAGNGTLLISATSGFSSCSFP